MLSFEAWFSTRHASIPVTSAKAVLALSEGGATLPFIARYRKEQTGNLDEVAIQSVLDAKEAWDAVEHRKKFICEEIEKQGKLTPELKEKILATYELERLEDLYLPYKQKRKTKAMVAREAGLEPLADWMWRVSHEDAPADAHARREGGRLRRARQERRHARAGDRGRARHRRRAARRGRGAARAGAAGALRARASCARPRARRPSRTASSSATSPTTSAWARSCAPRRRTAILAMRRGFMEEELVAVDRRRARATRRSTRTCSRPSSAPLARARRRRRRDVMKRAARLALRAYVQPSLENEVKQALARRGRRRGDPRLRGEPAQAAPRARRTERSPCSASTPASARAASSPS